MTSTVIIWLSIGAIFITGGIIVVNKSYMSVELGTLIIDIGVVSMLIGITYGEMLLTERKDEPAVYQEYITQQKDLETALNSSANNVVTAKLYKEAIAFNKDLSYKQYFYERGGYLPFSGKYDWSAIPHVAIPD